MLPPVTGSLNAHGMLCGGVAENTSESHIGYVAGRYRDGSRSDIWTDVRRCAHATFTRYVAACECGWYGKDHPATPSGYQASAREWAHGHRAAVADPNGVDRTSVTVCDASSLLSQAV